MTIGFINNDITTVGVTPDSSVIGIAPRASSISPRAVHWLWYPYVPLGKLTAVAGQMGQAKSLWTAWLAAAVTCASGINLGRPGSVIMLSAEDDPEDTTVPRLIAAGADLEKVIFPEDFELSSAVCAVTATTSAT